MQENTESKCFTAAKQTDWKKKNDMSIKLHVHVRSVPVTGGS